MNYSSLSWAGIENGIPHPTLDTQNIKHTLRDFFVDNAQAGLDIIKDQVKKTVYNDKNLDLPELSFFKSPETNSSANSPTARHSQFDGFSKVSNSGGRDGGFVHADNVGDRTTAPLKVEKGFDKKFEITSDGREREYTLHVPPGYDGKTPMPLVVVLHGLSQDADSIAKLSAMSEKADKEGFIVAYPNATKWLGVSSLRAWDVDNGVQIPGTDSNDVGFVRNMVNAIKDNMAVDDKRVFAAGFSNGGMLTYKLASEMSDTFSAVAVVAGGSDGKETKPSNDVSVMAIHGSRDHVVPKDGSWFGSRLVDLGVPDFQSFKDSFKHWKEFIGVEEKPDFYKDQDVFSARAVNQKTGAEVVSYVVEGGKHEWPGSARAIKTNPNSAEARFNATDKIWDFFKSHPRKQDSKPQAPRSAEPLVT